MKSFWSDEKTKEFSLEVEYISYVNELINKEKNLGVTSSIKGKKRDIFSEEREIITLNTHGEFEDIDVQDLERFLSLVDMSDERLLKELNSKQNSTDFLLHSAVSSKYVSTIYSNLLLSIENTVGAEPKLKEIFGDSVLVIPYTSSQIELAKVIKDALKHIDINSLDAIIVLNHVVITFGDDAKSSYEDFVKVSKKALSYLTKNSATICGEDEVEGNLSLVEGLASFFEAFVPKPKKCLFGTNANFIKEPNLIDLLKIRNKVSTLNKRAVLGKFIGGDKSVHFSLLEKIDEIVQKGFVTPKLNCSVKIVDGKKLLEKGANWIVYKGYGNLAFGENKTIVESLSTVVDSSISTIIRSETLGGYSPLQEENSCNSSLEYKEYSGKVVVITNVVNSIGISIISKLLEKDAVVFALDSREEVKELFTSPNYRGLVCDMLSEECTDKTAAKIAKEYCAVDVLISNIGGKAKGIGVNNWQKMLDQNFTMHKNIINSTKKYLEYGFNPVITTLATKELIRGLIDGDIIKKIEDEQQLVIDRTKQAITSPKIRVNSVITAARYNSTNEQMDELDIGVLSDKSNEVSQVVSTICSNMFKNTKNLSIKVD